MAQFSLFMNRKAFMQDHHICLNEKAPRLKCGLKDFGSWMRKKAFQYISMFYGGTKPQRSDIARPNRKLKKPLPARSVDLTSSSSNSNGISRGCWALNSGCSIASAASWHVKNAIFIDADRYDLKEEYDRELLGNLRKNTRTNSRPIGIEETVSIVRWIRRPSRGQWGIFTLWKCTKVFWSIDHQTCRKDNRISPNCDGTFY